MNTAPAYRGLLTTKLLWVLLHVGQHERVGVGDEEEVSEYVDHGADAISCGAWGAGGNTCH